MNDTLADDGWKSPDSYGNDFAEPGEISAVYLFMAVNMDDMTEFHVAYVGMSKRLASRWAKHPTLREIKKGDFYIKRLFKPTPEDKLRTIERHYIQKFDPPWNLAGRVRGLRK